MPRLAIAIALCGLVVLSFVERWAMLDASPYPVGVDGYFYPLQVRSLLEHGELHYPAAPVAFWLMLPFAAVTDPITGAKLGAALFGALVALPAYGVGARLGRSRGAGLVAAVLATTSAGSAFLTIEFVNNGIGLTLLLLALWLLLRALDSPTRSRIAFAVAGAALAIGSHKMAAALLVVFAVPAIVGGAAGRGVLRGRRLLYTILLVAGVTALLLALGAAFPKQLPSTGELDLARTFGGDARWDAPALVTRSVTLTFGHEAAIAGVLACLAVLVLPRTGRRAIEALVARLPARFRGTPVRNARPGETAVAWTAVALALAIAWPALDVSDAQGLGFRLRIAAFVPLALVAAIVAGRLFARVARRDVVLAIVAFVLVTRTPGDRDEGKIQAHPAMVAAIHALASEVPASDTIVVPERHIVFMVAWYTRANVRIRPELVPPERRWRLVPLAWIGLGSPLDDALRAARDQPELRPPLGLHPRHPNGLVLIAEPTWQWVLASLPPEVRARWARWRTI